MPSGTTILNRLIHVQDEAGVILRYDSGKRCEPVRERSDVTMNPANRLEWPHTSH